MSLWMKLRTDDKGASMVEYALLVVLIAIVAIVALTLLGGNIAELFERTASEIGNGTSPGTTAP